MIERQMLVQLNVECVKNHIQHQFIVNFIFIFILNFCFLLIDLSEAVDVYNSWIDACEEQNRG